MEQQFMMCKKGGVKRNRIFATRPNAKIRVWQRKQWHDKVDFESEICNDGLRKTARICLAMMCAVWERAKFLIPETKYKGAWK